MGLLVGMAFIALPGLGWGLQYFPGDLGDGRFNLYLLEHAYRYFTGQIDYFWGAPFMYPAQNVISYSDNLLGSAPIYALFRAMGASEFSAYQYWYLAVAALNYLAAYALLRSVFRNRYAAVLGAFVFAFSLALQSQLAHAQTFPRFAIPLAIWAAVKFGRDFQPRYFFLTVLLVVYQMYCGIYLGFFLMVATVPILVLLVLRRWSTFVQRARRSLWWVSMVFSTAVGVVVLLPLILPYVRRSTEVGMTPYSEVVGTLPTISSYFFAKDGSLIWGFLENHGKDNPGWWDFQLFAGGVATLCLVAVTAGVLWKWSRVKFDVSRLSVPAVLSLGGIVVFLLFLRFGEALSAYAALYALPGFGAMRSLTRIINVELVFYAIATAWVFAAVLPSAKKGVVAFAGFAGVLALLIFDNYLPVDRHYHYSVDQARNRTQAIDSIFASIPAGSVVSYEPTELDGPSIHYQIDAMLAAQRHDLLTVNGYSATSPHGFDAYWRSPEPATRNWWLADKSLSFDTLYVVRSPGELLRGPIENIHPAPSTDEIRVQDMIEHIRSDPEWMESIRAKATERDISVDSMLRLDAEWALKHQ